MQLAMNDVKVACRTSAPTYGPASQTTIDGFATAGQLLYLGKLADHSSSGVQRYSRVRGQFCSTEADDDAQTLTINAIYRKQSGESVEYDVVSLGTIAVTNGSSTGLSGSAFADNTFRYADTYGTFTPSAFGTAMLTAEGGSVEVSSPGSNTNGHFIVGETGGAYALLFSVGNSITARVIAGLT